MGLPDFVINAIREPWENATDNQLIFHTKNNTPIPPRNLLRHFHATLNKLGIPRVHLHSLRHTFTSLLIPNTDPKTIQQLLGHASIQTTFNIYGHLMPGYEKETARKLDGLLEGG